MRRRNAIGRYVNAALGVLAQQEEAQCRVSSREAQLRAAYARICEFYRAGTMERLEEHPVMTAKVDAAEDALHVAMTGGTDEEFATALQRYVGTWREAIAVAWRDDNAAD